MFVKPADDPNNPGHKLIVRVPGTYAALPDGGREVPDTLFWRRRVRDGDVLLVKSEQGANT